MRVLQINKFLWLSGGAERYMFDLSALLEVHGHEIVHFAMHDSARNRPSAQAEFFVSNLDYKALSPAGAASRAARIFGGTVYSFEARRKLGDLLRKYKPDIAHVHLIDHHLSPSILYALRDARVPVVQTIHDYKLICPNYQLYVPQKGELCERCLPGKFHHCLGQRCMKHSLAASALVAGAAYVHKALRIYENHVDSFLCSTEFLRAKLEEGGVPKNKLRHVPLTIDFDRFQRDAEPGDYIAYVGRIVPEKGIETLLQAMRQLPDIQLVLLGDGPERAAFALRARDLGLDNVTFRGFVDGDALVDCMSRARCLVLPSELYETCGLVVWEAGALGRPSIGSAIGGIPESIRDGETGLLFEPGNSEDLARQIRRLYDDGALASEMGLRARERVDAECRAHYDRIRAVYDEAIAGVSR